MPSQKRYFEQVEDSLETVPEITLSQIQESSIPVTQLPIVCKKYTLSSNSMKSSKFTSIPKVVITPTRVSDLNNQNKNNHKFQETIEDKTITDLMKSSLIKLGDELEYRGHIGVITREGWIDSDFKMERFKTVKDWCDSIFPNHNKGLNYEQIFRSIKVSRTGKSLYRTLKKKEKINNSVSQKKTSTFYHNNYGLSGEDDSSQEELFSNNPPSSNKQLSNNPSKKRKLVIDSESEENSIQIPPLNHLEQNNDSDDTEEEENWKDTQEIPVHQRTHQTIHEPTHNNISHSLASKNNNHFPSPSSSQPPIPTQFQIRERELQFQLQRERNLRMELENERRIQIEKELERERELKREIQKEMEIQRELEFRRELEKREKELEIEKERERERQFQRERELEREREIQRELERERQLQRERDIQREKEREKKNREIQLKRERDIDTLIEKEKEQNYQRRFIKERPTDVNSLRHQEIISRIPDYSLRYQSQQQQQQQHFIPTNTNTPSSFSPPPRYLHLSQKISPFSSLPNKDYTSSLSKPLFSDQNHEYISNNISNNNNNNNNRTPPVVLSSGLNGEMLTHLRILISQLGGQLLTEWSTQVTHLIVMTDLTHRTVPPETMETMSEESGDNMAVDSEEQYYSNGGGKVLRRTFKYLMSILSGCWIVSFDWIIRSTKNGRWVDETPFEVEIDGEKRVNINSWHSTLHNKTNEEFEKIFQKGGKQARTLLRERIFSKRLFFGYRFYIYGRFHEDMTHRGLTQSNRTTSMITRNQLKQLIECGNGRVLDKMPRAPRNTKEMLSEKNQKTIILWICQEETTNDEFEKKELEKIFFSSGRTPLTIDWFLDSISCYTILRQSNYFAYLSLLLNDKNQNKQYKVNGDSELMRGNSHTPNSFDWQTQNSTQF